MTTGFGSTPDARGGPSAYSHFRALPPRFRDIIRLAAERHEVDPLHVIAGSQVAAVVAARRQIVAQLLAEGKGWSAIGRILRRHHTTINRNSRRAMRKRKRNRFRKASGTNLLGNSEKRHAAHLKRQKPSRFTEPATSSTQAQAPQVKEQPASE